MNCRKYEKLMMKYFDRNITDSDSSALMLHVKTCGTCADTFEHLKTILGSIEQNIEQNIEHNIKHNIKHNTNSNVPDTFESAVMNKIKRYAESNTTHSKQAHYFTTAQIAAAVIIPLVYLAAAAGNISIFDIIMMLSRVIVIIDMLPAGETLAFINSYLPVQLNIVSAFMYAGLSLITVAVIVSVKIIADLKHNAVQKENRQ